MAKKKRTLGTDLAKLDAYVLGPEDYAEIPELTDEWFARGVLMRNGKPITREELSALSQKPSRRR